MIIGITGPIGSGKTTVAAGVFSRLKKYGMAAEYVSEYARRYIRGKVDRYPYWLPNNFDQFRIMMTQFDEEEMHEPTNVTMVTDTSPLNSLLYISHPVKNDYIINDFYSLTLERKDVIYFHCLSVPNPTIKDPNRIHDAEQIKALEEKCSVLVTKIHSDFPNLQIHTLSEMDVDSRIDIAVGVVLRESIKSC